MTKKRRIEITVFRRTTIVYQGQPADSPINPPGVSRYGFYAKLRSFGLLIKQLAARLRKD